jgi:uncharacterized membrane protein YsdA (DUF1294 family)
MRQRVIYTALGVVLAVMLNRSLQSRISLSPYIAWIGSFSLITWAFYGWDKRVSELKTVLQSWRIPEFTLNLITLLGGFPGAWAGRAMFKHKTNVQRHRGMFALLLASTFLHILLVIRLLYGPPITLWPPENWWSF